MQPFIDTAPFELPHLDFMSIEMTMELDQPVNLVNVLVLFDHFTKHVMAYMTPNQTTKTVAKFLWQGYILNFGAPAKLLSNWDANFESNIIKRCVSSWAYGRLGLHLTMLRPMGKIEQAHQMLTCTIGKLIKDQKADWPKHLPELLHAYNSMRVAITRYSPHYLMFGHWPCLPIDFYFPMIQGMEKHWCID